MLYHHYDEQHCTKCNENVCLLVSFTRVGIQLPTIEVRYENVCVEAECYVGDRALPTLVNAARNALEVTHPIPLSLPLCLSVSLSLCLPHKFLEEEEEEEEEAELEHIWIHLCVCRAF